MTTPDSPLRRLRLDAGMTQRQVADHVGVSHQAVSSWEKGTRPRPASLTALSELFGVPVADIDPALSSPNDGPHQLDDPPAYRAGVGHTWQAIPDDAWHVICDHARRRGGTPTELLRAFARGLETPRRRSPHRPARPDVRSLVPSRTPRPVPPWEGQP